MDLLGIKGLVKERCGLSFDGHMEPVIVEAVGSRMAERSVSSADSYLILVEKDDDEFQRLVNLLTTNETYFYREPVHLDILAERLMPAFLTEKGPGGVTRVLSAGCSTGEEPYSLAIALMDRFGKGVRDTVEILGFDIDDDTLSKAREGVYGAHSFRGMEGRLLSGYFDRQEDGRQRVKDEVRGGVRFFRHNILSGDFPHPLKGVDVIFYRNVSIYFDAETRAGIFRNLAGLLNDGGCLVMSATETFSHNMGLLNLVEMGGAFIFRKSGPLGDAGAHRPSGVPDIRREFKSAGRSLIGGRPPVTRSAPVLTKPAMRPGPVRGMDDALALVRGKRYTEALPLLDALVLKNPGDARVHALRGFVLLCVQRPAEAEGSCLRSVEIDRFCLEALVTLGVIARERDDLEGAVKRFREAIYVRPSSWPAHYYLAESLRLRGDAVQALRECDIVTKILDRAGGYDEGMGFLPMPMTEDEVRRVCGKAAPAYTGVK